MINEEWTTRIRGWLESGKDGADNIVDIPWEVELDTDGNYDTLTCSHPSIPFKVSAIVSGDFVTVLLDTGVPTDAQDIVDRMRLYRTFLKKNLNWNLVKVTLLGDDCRVGIAVDLDLSSLGKDEFDTALNNAVYGSMETIDIMGLKEELRDWFFNQIVADCGRMMGEGKSKGDVVEYLVNRVGWERESAVRLVDELARNMESGGEEQPAKGSTANYIR